MATEELIVTVQDLYSVPSWNGQAGYCGRMSRRWFEVHGLDWSAFLRDGIAASVVEATGDALAQRVVYHARALRAAQGASGGQ